MYSYWLVHTLHMYSYGLVHVVDIVPSPEYLDYVLMRSRSYHDLVVYMLTTSGPDPDLLRMVYGPGVQTLESPG